MLTEWCAPGEGATLALVKTLLHGTGAAHPSDWSRKTSLRVDLEALAERAPDEGDRMRLQEILDRQREGRVL